MLAAGDSRAKRWPQEPDCAGPKISQEPLPASAPKSIYLGICLRMQSSRVRGCTPARNMEAVLKQVLIQSSVSHQVGGNRKPHFPECSHPRMLYTLGTRPLSYLRCPRFVVMSAEWGCV